MRQTAHHQELGYFALLACIGVLQNGVDGFLLGIFDKTAGIDDHRLAVIVIA